jgi:hypothetical protein
MPTEVMNNLFQSMHKRHLYADSLERLESEFEGENYLPRKSTMHALVSAHVVYNVHYYSRLY